MLYLVCQALLSENIKSVDFLDTEEQPLAYPFKIKCTSCHEVDATVHKFDRKDEVDRETVGTVNFLMKCKFCASTCSVSFKKTSEQLYNVVDASTEDDSDSLKDLQGCVSKQLKSRSSNYPKVVKKTRSLNNFAIFLEFDCRGCEIVEFIPDESTTLKVTLNNGQTIENVLEDGELFDYDDKDEEEVSITELKWDLIKA